MQENVKCVLLLLEYHLIFTRFDALHMHVLASYIAKKNSKKKKKIMEQKIISMYQIILFLSQLFFSFNAISQNKKVINADRTLCAK